MPEVLDQSEVDALLAAVGGGQSEQPAAPTTIFSRSRRDRATVEVRGYDFKRPERVGKEQMRALQTLHEAFARNFGASLSGFLRTIVEVKVATCEQMTYLEFVHGLPNPTSFNLIQPDALEGQICLEISPLIIYPIIDRLLGGTSRDLFIPQRPMTVIESRLISSVTGRGLAALAEAWSSVRELKFTITASESNPQLVQIVSPNEVVVVVGFEIKLANRAGTMNLCIPYNVIEPVMEFLSSQSWFAATKHNRSKEFEGRILSHLNRAPLGVTAVLAETTITLDDLQGLAPGDIILTGKAADRPVKIEVESQHAFDAHLGQHRGARAVRIVRAIPKSAPK